MHEHEDTTPVPPRPFSLAELGLLRRALHAGGAAAAQAATVEALEALVCAHMDYVWRHRPQGDAVDHAAVLERQAAALEQAVLGSAKAGPFDVVAMNLATVREHARLLRGAALLLRTRPPQEV